MQPPEKIENAQQAEQALDYVLQQPFVPVEIGAHDAQEAVGAFTEYAADAEEDLRNVAFNGD